MKRITLFLLALLCLSGNAQASTFSDLAASLTGRQWALLTGPAQAGYTDDLLNGHNNGCTTTTSGMYSYASRGVYDPVTDRLYYTGGGHYVTGTCRMETIQYDVATHLWSNLGVISGYTPGGNATQTYDSNAINPGKRERYFFNMLANGASNFFRFNIDTATSANDVESGLPASCVFSSGEPTIVYFPERDELLYHHQNNICAWRKATASWSVVATSASLTALGPRGAHARYDPVHKKVWFYGGCVTVTTDCDTYRKGVYRYDADGTITRVSDMPALLNVKSWNQGVGEVDPATGNIVLLAGDAGTGMKMWEGVTSSTDIAWTDITAQMTIPSGWIDSGLGTYAIIAYTVPKYGVLVFCSGGDHDNQSCYVYKNTTNTLALSGCDFTCRRNGPGVLNSWAFDSVSELRYNWLAGDTKVNAIMSGMGISTNNGISSLRTSGQGNVSARRATVVEANMVQNYVPQIDTSTFFEGGGALRMALPSNSGEQPGYFQDNLTGVLGTGSNANCMYIAPANATGGACAGIAHKSSVFYFQARMRINAAALAQFYDSDQNFGNFQGRVLDGATSGAGSVTVTSAVLAATPSLGWEAGDVGRKLAIHTESTASNCVGGIYTITQFNSASSVNVNTSPSPSGACSGAQLRMEHLASGNEQSGWKAFLVFGNAPDGESGSTNSAVVNNGSFFTIGCANPKTPHPAGGFPQFYALNGGTSPSCANDTVPWLADTWMEFDARVEVGSDNVANSRITSWLNGTQWLDWTTAQFNYDSAASGGAGQGIGQIMLTPFLTAKDPTQNHTDAYFWFDNLITSTQPIPMQASVSGTRVIKVGTGKTLKFGVQ